MNKPFYIFFVIAFAISTTCVAQQNLVPNPSFEIHDSCPNSLTFIQYATPWFSPSDGTSDYFNDCNNLMVPLNDFGYQYPRTGNAYAGLLYINYGTDDLGFEYISVPLLETLRKYRKYTLQLFINIADSVDGIHGNFRTTGSAISPIGCLFTVDRPQWHVYGYNNFDGYIKSPFPASAESDSTVLLIDSVGWQDVNITYCAKGGEQFLTIGFFRTKNGMNYNHSINDGSLNTYYYIDDVSLTENGDCFPEKLANIFTPNGDGINDVFYIDTSLAKKINIQIFNRWGNAVFESTNKTLWDGNNGSGKPFSEGVYYYLVSFINEGEQKNYKGFIQLVR